MTSETTFYPRRQTMLAMFAAVAFFGAASIAQAQSTTTAPARTTPGASATTPGTPGAGDTTRSGSMNAQGSTAAAGSPTQVNPNARDSNRQASQGMVPSTDRDSSAQARVDAPDSNLRNDRTTMARAPRADRN